MPRFRSASTLTTSTFPSNGCQSAASSVSTVALATCGSTKGASAQYCLDSDGPTRAPTAAPSGPTRPPTLAPTAPTMAPTTTVAHSDGYILCSQYATKNCTGTDLFHSVYGINTCAHDSTAIVHQDDDVSYADGNLTIVPHYSTHYYYYGLDSYFFILNYSGIVNGNLTAEVIAYSDSTCSVQSPDTSMRSTMHYPTQCSAGRICQFTSEFPSYLLQGNFFVQRWAPCRFVSPSLKHNVAEFFAGIV